MGKMLVNLSLTVFFPLPSFQQKMVWKLVWSFISLTPLESIKVTLDLLPSQITSLQEQANKLEKDGGLDGVQIQHKLDTILQRKKQIKNLSQSRREKLQTALLLALFYQNLAEVREIYTRVGVEELGTTYICWIKCLFSLEIS